MSAQSSSRFRANVLGWLVATSLLVTAVAVAQAGVVTRTMGVVFRSGSPHFYYSARDLINREAEKKLDSGLPQRIVVQHFAYVQRRSEPVAVSATHCKVVYDLWQAAYRVEYETIGGLMHNHTLGTRAEVLELCLVMRNQKLGEASDYGSHRRMHVASLIELNPLSSSTIARIRRWLSRPRGEYNLESRSFFGSFVSLFVNDRIGTAERTLRLRSQDLEIP